MLSLLKTCSKCGYAENSLDSPVLTVLIRKQGRTFQLFSEIEADDDSGWVEESIPNGDGRRPPSSLLPSATRSEPFPKESVADGRGSTSQAAACKRPASPSTVTRQRGSGGSIQEPGLRSRKKARYSRSTPSRQPIPEAAQPPHFEEQG